MYVTGMAEAKEFLETFDKASLPTSPSEAINHLLKQYSNRGFGTFQVDALDERTRTTEISSQDSAEALAFREKGNLQREPVCSYISGVLTWICRLVLDKDSAEDSDIMPLEIECLGVNQRACKFVVAPVSVLRERFPEMASPLQAGPEYTLKFNEEILEKNLELQGLNLSLERQVRKRTEDLWKAEGNYRSLLAMLPDPVGVLTVEGNVVAFNPAGLRLLGLDTAEEATALKASSLFVEGARTWEKIIWLLEKEGSVHGLETEILTKDGQKAYVEVTARFTELQQGRFVEAILNDITQQRLLEKEMKEAQTESEHLNDLMSHDIMNYTYAAMHYLEKLRQSPNLTEDEKRDFGMITKEVQGAFELSASVRDLSRLRTLDEETMTVVDLKPILTESLENARRMFLDKVVKVNMEKPVEPCYVNCNALASNLFTNLLTNAIKFDSHPEIVIDISIDSVTENGISFWRIRISDRGKGIPEDQKKKVFERFHRVDRSVSGSGLGLYVVKYIASACGGVVSAENRVQGDHTKGTTMSVLLQKADERQVARLVRKI
ncbi:MAG: ATP-binding protein [Thermoplasmata archaeon]|nr:ATP-binding protein [Thermoplasmata archaeon]